MALTTVFLSGCDKVEDLSDFKFNSEFEESIPMKDESTGENKAYSQNIVIDLTTDSQIKTYESKIKSITIEKLTYTIDDSKNPTTSADATFSGTMSFSDKNGNGTTGTTTIKDLKLNDHTTVHELTIAQADLDKIAGYLKNDKAVKVSMAGTVSKTPINIIVNVQIKVVVTSNVL